jgi:N-formylmaleamate deformylase
MRPMSHDDSSIGIAARVSLSAKADLNAVPACSIWATSSNDLRIHAFDYGGEGIPILLLPGITSPAIALDFIARKLVDLGRVIVVDLRGRGMSDDAQTFTLDDYADDVDNLADQWKLDGALLIGHSLGARIAAAVSARGSRHAVGAILMDPPMSAPDRAYPTSLTTFLSQWDEASAGTDANAVARSWPGWPRRELELRARWLSSCSRESIIGTHMGFETEQFEPLWAQVPANTVLVHGQRSTVVTAADVIALHSARPEISMHSIADAGHMLPWDNFDETIAVLRSLISGFTERYDQQ